MDLYLAGPMRNYPRWNFDAFEHSTKALRAEGHTVRSPHEHDLAMGLDPDAPDADENAEGALPECLRWDFTQICEAGNIVLLPGWEESAGCAMELRVARDTKANVYELLHASEGRTMMRPLNPHEQTARQDGFYCGVPTGDVNKVQWTTDPGPQVPVIIPGLVTDSLRGFRPLGFSDGAGNLGEFRVTDAETGGMKGSKVARMDLLPWDALLDLSIHFGVNSDKHGGKYPDRNWEKGYSWSLGIASLGRHLAAWLSGEEYDEEGHPHIRAIHWHAATLHAFSLRGVGTDDRRLP